MFSSGEVFIKRGPGTQREFLAFCFLRPSEERPFPERYATKEESKWQDFREKLSGSIIVKGTALSGKMVEPTFLFIIQQSKVTDSSLSRKVTRSSLKLFRGRKDRKPIRSLKWSSMIIFPGAQHRPCNAAEFFRVLRRN